MRAYLEIAKISFKSNLVYRIDFVASVLNAIVMIFVNIAIWRAIYEEQQELEGVQFKIVVTYIVLSFLMQTIFTMDEYFIESRIRSGLISSDMIKPISFRMHVMSYHLGSMLYKIILQLLPAFAVCMLIFNVLPPFSLTMFLYFLASAVLGYMVLYHLNFIVWLSSFWFFGTFSLITIKDAMVLIFSGALIPLWFMPQAVSEFIRYTPFDTIFSIPLRIYLGMVTEQEIVSNFIRQALWLLGLFVVSQLLWKLATKRLVIQGG